MNISKLTSTRTTLSFEQLPLAVIELIYFPLLSCTVYSNLVTSDSSTDSNVCSEDNFFEYSTSRSWRVSNVLTSCRSSKQVFGYSRFNSFSNFQTCYNVIIYTCVERCDPSRVRRYERDLNTSLSFDASSFVSSETFSRYVN